MPALFAAGAEVLGGLGLFGGGAAAAEGGALAAGALGGAELGGAAGAAAGGGLFEGLGAGAAGLLAEGAGDAFASAGGSSFGGLLEGSGAPSAFGQLGASAGGNAGGLTAIPGAAAVSEAATAGAGAVGGGASAGAAGTAGGSAGSSSVFGNLLSSATANPLQTAGLGLGAAGLGYNIMQGQSTSANARKLAGSADHLNMQGQMLSTYLETGKLPAGLQAAVGKANEAAKARAIQNAARAGMPTDPSQNSALAQDLNNIDQQSIIQTAEIGQKLLTTGINEIGLADQLYAQLVNIDQKQAATTGNAIMNFAGALAGGRAQPQRAAA